MILNELIQKIERKYPRFLAESWDNVGLMIGDLDANIKKVLVALEANEAVIEEAITNKVNLIVTHHPFFFSKFNQINTSTLKGKLSLRLIQNGIALYSMHTNYDCAFDGMNDQLLKRLHLSATDTFHSATSEEWYTKMNDGKVPGLGRIAKLNKAITLSALCEQIKTYLNMPHIRFTGDANTYVQTIAVITGSASDMFPDAKAAGADVLISGDMKYHTAQDALDANMNVIDCGHFETEDIFKDAMREFLESICDLQILSSSINLNPFQYI